MGGPFADEKCRMNHGAQMLLGRAVQKGDVVYDVRLVQGSGHPGKFIATVALPGFADGKYEGEPFSDKKSAENSAAAKFLETFEDEIAEKKAERDERVEQRRLEKEAE